MNILLDTGVHWVDHHLWLSVVHARSDSEHLVLFVGHVLHGRLLIYQHSLTINVCVLGGGILGGSGLGAHGLQIGHRRGHHLSVGRDYLHELIHLLTIIGGDQALLLNLLLRIIGDHDLLSVRSLVNSGRARHGLLTGDNVLTSSGLLQNLTTTEDRLTSGHHRGLRLQDDLLLMHGVVEIEEKEHK